eukprot:gb/GECG01011937.1/.p1 GENE.gb/GECG01011937.1/~~gb/GECG01011937.1/.p1  ORF type:complete len:444 (+),score=44.82 gb/GECG01011937.1/:1-1332(+)
MADFIDLTKDHEEELRRVDPSSSHQDASARGIEQEVTVSSGDTWACDNCGFINHVALPYCEQCAHQPQNGRATSTSASTCSSASALGSSYGSQYTHGGWNTSSDTDMEIVQASAAISTNWTKDSGIVALLQMAYEQELKAKPKLWKSIRLCENVDHFTQSTSYLGPRDSWSCGYRNIQILCSSLMQSEKYRPRLFDGTGKIPDVNGIQRYIQEAWLNGFDPEGKQHFGGFLAGTQSKIGATECATLLRYFAIPAFVIDFYSSTDPQLPLVLNEIRNSGSMDVNIVDLQNSPSLSVLSGHHQHAMLLWLYNYFNQTSMFSSGTCRAYSDGSICTLRCFPIFFQEDGHSRTIAGTECASTKQNGNQVDRIDRLNFIVLDPLVTRTEFANSVNSGKNWQCKVKRGTHTFKKQRYQAVVVPQPDAPMSSSHTERGLRKHIGSDIVIV